MWNKHYELIEIAYGMQKIRMCMTVEDDKVSSDDFYEVLIAKYVERIQSIDTVSFSKL